MELQFTISAVLCLGLLLLDPTVAVLDNKTAIRAYLTTVDQANLFELQSPVPLGPPPTSQPTIRITTSKRYQPMVGLAPPSLTLPLMCFTTPLQRSTTTS
eukprot:m.223437 g.223437  ORF g.223437 m.223437 type:complete len:100 (+) comp17268_c0_seq3:1425-1724(+)